MNKYNKTFNSFLDKYFHQKAVEFQLQLIKRENTVCKTLMYPVAYSVLHPVMFSVAASFI